MNLERYALFSELTSSQKEAIIDLLSETISSTIFDFMRMFEQNSNQMKMLFTVDGKEYDLVKICEVMGSEIVDGSEDGWISMFSKLGRFVL